MENIWTLAYLQGHIRQETNGCDKMGHMSFHIIRVSSISENTEMELTLPGCTSESITVVTMTWAVCWGWLTLQSVFPRSLVGLSAVSAHACWDYKGYIKKAHREESHDRNHSQKAGLSSDLQKNHQKVIYINIWPKLPGCSRTPDRG